MRSSNFVSAVGVALVASCIPALGQSVRIDGGAINREGFTLHWETRLEPPLPALSGGVISPTIASNREIRRTLLDHSRRVFVGYAIDIDPLPRSEFRVVLRPLPLSPALVGGAGKTWTELPTPGWNSATPQIVRLGDVFAVDLLVNPATGQKIVDYLSIQERMPNFRGFSLVPPREFAFAPGPPRDFTARDAELRVREPRLTINGQVEQSTIDHPGEAAGTVIWFYASERGRFMLSLIPRPELGFRRAGEVRGTSLSFAAGGDTFVLSSGIRIVGQAPFNLYVRHDPAWRPTYPHANLSAFIIDATDDPELLIGR